ALTVFHNVLERRPRMPEAHVNMGFALLGMKKYAAARDFFNSAIDLHPAQANAYYGLGEALDAMGDRDGAIGAMRAFVHLAPPNDKFRVRAEAAIWELTEARDAAKTMKKGK
ncbi:MAG TPA: tetratricopeptide repeat protein, partial [Usitatibacteraceae bacterium]|nr:tetratricopeptide repeat protein [Usitatibacteraceae bacterium]